MEQAETSESTESNRTRLIVLACLIAVALGALSFFFTFCAAEPDDGILIGAGVQKGSPTAPAEAEPGVNGPEQFSVQLNAEPHFASGASSGNLNIANPLTNTLSIRVLITLEDTGEVVYESGVIPPDHFVGDDVLLVDLPKGEHKAKARVTPFDPNDPDRPFNEAGFDLNIVVEE